MKNYLLLFCCLIIACFGYTQNNIVGNPSFENILPGGTCIPPNGNASYANMVNIWSYEYPWTVPQKKEFCISGVGTPDWDCNGGHTGLHYGFCLPYEYIVAPLEEALVVGKRYYIEYWVKGIEVRHNSGLKFFEGRPKQCGGNELSDDSAPEVGMWDPVNATSWSKQYMYYTATHEYSWIGLGSFDLGKKGNDQPSYSFDDISIIEVGNSECPDANYIQDAHFQNIGLITYASQNLTEAGYNVTNAVALGNVLVDNNAAVEFKSAKQVALEPGFSADGNSAYFEAHIAPCDADCFPPTANAGADAISCGNQTVQLGIPSSEFEITYSWTANPASALSYLSNPTISNPVFTPPASGSGIITYTLKATNACGNSVTDNVIIKYDASSNNTPTVSVSNVTYSDLIEFDAIFSSHTAQLIIEVWTAGSSSLINTYTYNAGTDFNCCNYHWKIPTGLSPCNDYPIRVYAKNLCATAGASNLSQPAIVNWTRNRNLAFTQVSNVITQNEHSWCFTFTGATQYHEEIWDPNGNLIYQSSGAITPPSACIWNGQCNTGIYANSTAVDGTYYYSLTITGCNGNTLNKVGYLLLLLGEKSMITTQDSLSTSTENASLNNIEIYPNPNNGIFIIKSTGFSQKKIINKITIYNAMGSIIQKTELSDKAVTIDISSQAKGMYFVTIEDEQGIIEVKKIIYE